MPRMQFGITAFERARGDLPELPVINMFAERDPTEETGLILQSRPPLNDRSADMGAGPVQSLFKGNGVLDGALYGVSNTTLYRETTSVGAVDGSGPFSMAGYANYLFAAGGGQLWSYDGVTLAAVTFPDGAAVTKCLVGASRVICVRADTGTFYWSDPLVTTIDALSFATAENQPDNILDALFIGDALWLFGAETVEVWPNTGDATLPFQPLEGSVFKRGVKNTGAAVAYGTTFAWVTDQNQVCVGNPDNIITNPGLEAKIGASSAAYLWTFFIEGTELLALRIDSGTWVYNRRAGTFSEFTSYGQTNFIPQCHSGGVFGSYLDGKTYDWGAGLDAGQTFERRFRGGFPLNSGTVTLNNVKLRCNVGVTDYLSGTYADPAIEMRLSRNAGKTWGEWRSNTLGAQAEYRKEVQWTGCGMAGQPGLLAEFRTTYPGDFRVSGVFVNEPFGGL